MSRVKPIGKISLVGHPAGEPFLLAQPVRDQMWNAFTAIHADDVTNKGLSQGLERAQADADLVAGADQACTSGVGLIDQLDCHTAVSCTGQPSAFCEQKASHFCHSTSRPASPPSPCPYVAAPS